LSKEFVRKWLIENGFQGKDGQQVPEMTADIITSISERYIELYEQITGDQFVRNDSLDATERIEKNIMGFIDTLN
jgi:phosphoribosylaminoimidazole-succinocarboxamide synthase